MANQLPMPGGEAEPTTITTAEIGSYITRYRNERINALPANLQDDSSSVWITKEKLVELFTQNPNAEGIRFYFGITDDPFVEDHGIHNLVLICTDSLKSDMVAEADTVLIVKNFSATPLGAFQAAICPPPVSRCTGRAF